MGFPQQAHHRYEEQVWSVRMGWVEAEPREAAPTVGSEATSCVTPAVAPACVFMTLRKMQEELDSSE